MRITGFKHLTMAIVGAAVPLSLAACTGPAAGVPGGSQPVLTASAKNVPAPDLSRRTLIFSDEFNADTLDRDKWNVVGPEFWVNNEQQAYIDRPDVVEFRPMADGADGGVLVLKPVFQAGFETPSGRKADFVSGRINTRDKFDFTYGRAEARIRMPDAVGVWPAFWLLGNGRWPSTGEIDIMEYVGLRDWSAVAIHGPGYSGDTPFVARRNYPAGNGPDRWHDYAVEWTKDRIAFEVDGDVFYTVTRADVEKKGPWVYDTPEFVILNFAVGGVYPAKTNFIEAPYSGVPQSTVDRIKAGELAMEVDWVRVYSDE